MAERLPTSVVFQRGSRHARRIALTFDDGPGQLTLRFLDALEAGGARGSFFVIGKKCEGFTRELAESLRRGHDVAGHGFTHTPFPQLGRRELEDELARTEALLPAATRQLKMVRPPYGQMTPFSLLHSYRAGYTSAMWSFDPLDWDARSPREIVEAVDPAEIRNGDIVLLHEGQLTLQALPEILARLKGAGFELVTITELLLASSGTRGRSASSWDGTPHVRSTNGTSAAGQ
jgi:peptidoglycan/xylan/chitin deacetylase (PgdA/CDA1 family)